MEEHIEQANRAKTIKNLIKKYSVEEITEGLGLQPGQEDLTYKYSRIHSDGSVVLSVPSSRYKKLSVHLSSMNPPDMTIARQYITPDKLFSVIDPLEMDDSTEAMLLSIYDDVSDLRKGIEVNNKESIIAAIESISGCAVNLKNILLQEEQ
jgi:hypothetical protein